MNLQFREALEADVAAIVALLANDALGATRENVQMPLPNAYQRAFAVIDRDPHQELMVAELGGEIVATFQLSFIQHLTYQGGIRAQIEAVRVKAGHQGQGIGKAAFEYAVDRARSKGAHLLQLTTDKQRPDAKRFYESLGFVASHEGMKLHVQRPG